MSHNPYFLTSTNEEERQIVAVMCRILGIGRGSSMVLNSDADFRADQDQDQDKSVPPVLVLESIKLSKNFRKIENKKLVKLCKLSHFKWYPNSYLKYSDV